MAMIEKATKRRETLDRKRRNVECEKDVALTVRGIHLRFEEERNYPEKQKLYAEQARQFTQYAAECIDDYDEYLMAYDMAGRNYFDIEVALVKGKITYLQVEKIYKIALKYIDGFEKLFRIDLLRTV